MTTPPGWHPDPSGRHQHRFWDGSGWTDQVSNDGATSTDPVDAPASPDAGSTGGDVWGTSGATSPEATKSKAPMFVGIAVVVALLVGGIFFLTNRDGGSSTSSGTGDHTLTVGSDEVTVHNFDVKAGDFVFIGHDEAEKVDGALGIPRSHADRLVDFDDSWTDLEDLFTDSNDLASDLFTSLFSDDVGTDDAGSDNGLRPPNDFDGIVVAPLGWNEFDGSSDRSATVIVAPFDTTFSVVLLSPEGETEVTLQIRVESPDEVPDPLDEDAVEGLYASDAMEDFRRRIAEEMGFTDRFGSDFTDDWTDDWSDDWTDWSDDWTDDWSDDWTDWSDDWTDWSDDWTDWSDDWTDWSDDWTDWTDEWSDEWSDWNDELSDLWSDDWTDYLS